MNDAIRTYLREGDRNLDPRWRVRTRPAKRNINGWLQQNQKNAKIDECMFFIDDVSILEGSGFFILNKITFDIPHDEVLDHIRREFDFEAVFVTDEKVTGCNPNVWNASIGIVCPDEGTGTLIAAWFDAE